MSQRGKPFRIICFGDSTTAPRENVDAYCDQLQREFPGAVLVNRGRRGDSTTMAKERLREDVLAAAPDLVIIQFGINDATVDVWKEPPAIASRVSLQEYAINLRGFIESISLHGAASIILTPNQVRWTAPMLQLYGKAPYKSDDPNGFTHILEAYAKAALQIGRERGIPVVDIYQSYNEWQAQTTRDCSELLLDGVHPNTAGHYLVAGETAKALKLHFGL